MFISTDFVEESSQNECEEKKEKRQTQTPVKKTGMYIYMFIIFAFFRSMRWFSYLRGTIFTKPKVEYCISRVAKSPY